MGDFFWLNSTLLMVVIIALAQLPSQLLAADKMMGFLDLRFAACYWTVVWPCMIVEFIGLTHATYLLKDFLAWAVGIDQNEGNPEKRMTKNFFYYLRCFISVAAVLFSLVKELPWVKLVQRKEMVGKISREVLLLRYRFSLSSSLPALKAFRYLRLRLLVPALLISGKSLLLHIEPHSFCMPDVICKLSSSVVNFS